MIFYSVIHRRFSFCYSLTAKNVVIIDPKSMGNKTVRESAYRIKIRIMSAQLSQGTIASVLIVCLFTLSLASTRDLPKQLTEQFGLSNAQRKCLFQLPSVNCSTWRKYNLSRSTSCQLRKLTYYLKVSVFTEHSCKTTCSLYSSVYFGFLSN